MEPKQERNSSGLFRLMLFLNACSCVALAKSLKCRSSKVYEASADTSIRCKDTEESRTTAGRKDNKRRQNRRHHHHQQPSGSNHHHDHQRESRDCRRHRIKNESSDCHRHQIKSESSEHRLHKSIGRLHHLSNNSESHCSEQSSSGRHHSGQNSGCGRHHRSSKDSFYNRHSSSNCQRYYSSSIESSPHQQRPSSGFHQQRCSDLPTSFSQPFHPTVSRHQQPRTVHPKSSPAALGRLRHSSRGQHGHGRNDGKTKALHIRSLSKHRSKGRDKSSSSPFFHQANSQGSSSRLADRGTVAQSAHVYEHIDITKQNVVESRSKHESKVEGLTLWSSQSEHHYDFIDEDSDFERWENRMKSGNAVTKGLFYERSGSESIYENVAVAVSTGFGHDSVKEEATVVHNKDIEEHPNNKELRCYSNKRLNHETDQQQPNQEALNNEQEGSACGDRKHVNVENDKKHPFPENENRQQGNEVQQTFKGNGNDSNVDVGGKGPIYTTENKEERNHGKQQLSDGITEMSQCEESQSTTNCEDVVVTLDYDSENISGVNLVLKPTSKNEWASDLVNTYTFQRAAEDYKNQMAERVLDSLNQLLDFPGFQDFINNNNSSDSIAGNIFAYDIIDLNLDNEKNHSSLIKLMDSVANRMSLRTCERWRRKYRDTRVVYVRYSFTVNSSGNNYYHIMKEENMSILERLEGAYKINQNKSDIQSTTENIYETVNYSAKTLL